MTQMSYWNTLSIYMYIHAMCYIVTPQCASGDETDEVVKTLAVELRGEGVVEEERWEEEEVGRREVIHAHPDDLSTSIRPYDGATVM